MTDKMLETIIITDELIHVNRITLIW